ncbi:MAG: 6-phosphogluconolactonase, partial [Alistipes sp.]|nr:6-phosphogluconolactonase [Alistipes sp.]
MDNKYALPEEGGPIEKAALQDIIRRYEKIPTHIFADPRLGTQYVAGLIVRAIARYEQHRSSSDFCDEPEPFVLGLTTGCTPSELYRELVRRHRAGEVSFANVAVFSLDEFYPIGPDEQQSRNFRIRNEFLNHIDILPENVHLPDGTVSEERISDYCAAYEASIRKIDLMILGLNRNGQVGFNEPGTYIKSRTRLVQLSYETRKIESRAFFSFDDTPKMDNKYALPEEGGPIEKAALQDIIRRYEKIPTHIFADPRLGTQYVAGLIVRAIARYEQHRSSSDFCDEPEPFVLGLTTGCTPSELYRELVRRHRAGEVSFANVAVFSLDEFYPIGPDEQQSRNFRIRNEFLNHIDILPENVHLPDGTVSEERISDYCAAYEASIRKIDLMILGLNRNGQVGFNEPGTYIKSRTRLVQLSYETRKIESRAFFSFDDTPKMAVTMGIDTLLRAERICLMAWGEEKADAIRRVVEGEVSPRIPASYLQSHPRIEVVIDEKASQQLTRKQHPWLVGPCEWTPKFIRKAVVWLCGVVGKPILKLTYKDYIENSLGELLEQGRTFDQINIDVFNDLQHTISGWPGGKPDADDSTRP